jgi:hypothetical protein|tara:strand:- start:24741 stop:25148 length:408 start_codon:yes stop_codon:yes gene_type:complete
MVTKLKIKNDPDKKKSIRIIDVFEKQTGLDLMDHCLIKVSPCKKFEFVYAFLNTSNLNSLISVILEEKITVYEKIDYTEKIMNKVKSGKLLQFKNEFVCEPQVNDNFSKIIENNIPQELIIKKIALEAFGKYKLN